MAREDMIVMSTKELRQLPIIHQVLSGKITQVQAGQILGLSDRQIRRLVKRVRTEAERGLAHRSRGRPSNRAIDGKIKTRVLRLYQARYSDFGPTLACEKLAERDVKSRGDHVPLRDDSSDGQLQALHPAIWDSDECLSG
jgi:transposase